MRKTHFLTVAAISILWCLSSTGCNPAAPAPVGNAGQWSGTTAQGSSISFTVSTDQKVTSLTVGYDFNGCKGTKAYSNLSLETAPDVVCIPGPCSPAITSYRAFGYADAAALPDGPSTEVNGFFLVSTAQGGVNFRNFPGCGTATGVAWTAARR